MPAYSGQILRIDAATGVASTTYLLVHDTDTLMASADSAATYYLCGFDLAAAPVLDHVMISGTLLDGSTYSYDALHFFARGKDCYILLAENAPEAVASVTASVSLGDTLNPFPYMVRGQTLDDQPLLTGQALSIRLNAAGHATAQTVAVVMLSDDDPRIQTNAETGNDPMIKPIGTPDAFPFDSGHVTLVSVAYHSATGDGSFDALRFSYASGSGTQVYYLPRNGSVDLSTVTQFLGETALTGSLNGIKYSDFGLNQDRQTTLGDASANFIQGGIIPDHITGNAGDDSLVGGLGADFLDGGTGNDLMHGGAQSDTMLGRAGNDQMTGGNDPDRMLGGAGADRLVGNWGNDTLFGGAGADRLASGSDNDLVFGGGGKDVLIGFNQDDTLDGGSGSDTLFGGNGIDHFVFAVDGATDHIADFEVGIDRIQLGFAFADLILTNLSPGVVQITLPGDVLIVTNLDGTLTAADLTAADFL